jgi:hypothetical protein
LKLSPSTRGHGAEPTGVGNLHSASVESAHSYAQSLKSFMLWPSFCDNFFKGHVI